MAFSAFRKRLLVAAWARSLSSVMAHAYSTSAYTYTDLSQIASVDGPVPTYPTSPTTPTTPEFRLSLF